MRGLLELVLSVLIWLGVLARGGGFWLLYGLAMRFGSGWDTARADNGCYKMLTFWAVLVVKGC